MWKQLVKNFRRCWVLLATLAADLLKDRYIGAINRWLDAHAGGPIHAGASWIVNRHFALTIAGGSVFALILIGHAITVTRTKHRQPGVVTAAEQLLNGDLHDQAVCWLSRRLSDRRFNVWQAALFGSILHNHYPTSDIDVLILFRPGSDRKIKQAGRAIKNDMASEFNTRFGHRLHTTLFHHSEEKQFDAFLSKLNKHEVLQIEGNQ